MLRRSQHLEIKCPRCNADSLFHGANFPRFDSSGFESYSTRCRRCRACLVGIIDPLDDKLLLSLEAEPDGTVLSNHENGPLI
jgi:hypothetical protein